LNIIKQLIKEEGDEFPLSKALTLFLEDIANGTIPKRIIDILSISVLIPLEKRGGGVRPIAMGDVFRKLAGKQILQVESRSLCRIFGNIQLGVGAKLGIERIVNSVQISSDLNPTFDILCLDFKNAFNSIDRIHIRNQLISHFPQLVAMFDSFYIKTQSPLVIPSGCSTDSSRFISSCQGVQQGDTLGPLLFALGLQPILLGIKEILDKHNVPNAISLVAAYLDDITLVAPSSVCIEIVEFVKESGYMIGLELRPQKSTVYLGQVNTPEGYLSAGFPIESILPKESGFRLLGSPVGSPEFILNWLVQYIEDEIIPTAKRINDILDPQIQFSFILYILQNKMNHLFRTVNPMIFNRATNIGSTDSLCDRIESIVKLLFHQVIQVDLTYLDWNQVKIPISNGGFGLADCHDTIYAAFMGSFLSTYPYMKQLFSKDNIWKCSMGQMFNNSSSYVNSLSSQTHEFLTLLNPRHDYHKLPQKFISKVIANVRVDEFIKYDRSSDRNNKYHLTRLGSIADSSSGHFLSAGAREAVRMTPDQFRYCLQFRLGKEFKNFPADAKCSCKHRKPLGGFGEHCLGCAKFGFVQSRHNAIRDLLIELASYGRFRSVVSEPAYIFLEPSTDSTLDDRKRPDILIRGVPIFKSVNDKNYHDVLIDVTVVHPASASYMDKFKTYSNPGVLSNVKYEQKMKKYNDKATMLGFRFIPFVVETFGRIHPTSLQFFQRLVTRASMNLDIEYSVLYNYYVRRLLVTVQRANASLVLSFAQRATIDEGRRQVYLPEYVQDVELNDPSL